MASTLSSTEEDSPHATEILSFMEEVYSQVAPPLAHAMRLSKGLFNDLPVSHRCPLIKGLQDWQLVRWLEDEPRNLPKHFPLDVFGAPLSLPSLLDGWLTVLHKPYVSVQQLMSLTWWWFFHHWQTD